MRGYARSVMSAPPQSVARFRQAYRASEISTRYRGRWHLAFTLGFGIGVIAFCLSRIAGWPTPLEWLAVPITFVYANLVEYWGHRTAMHRPVRGLRLIYRRHAGQHHRFFTDSAMALESERDLKAVLFPPILVGFFLTAFALPAGWLVAVLTTPNTAYLLVATALAYFLNYELLHLAYHLPHTHWLARVPGVARLRRLHLRHHDLRLMASCNFNITYPICDWVFRTLYRMPRLDTGAASPTRSSDD